MNVIDRIKAVREQNHKDYEFLADLTAQPFAGIEAELTAPDPGQGPRRPDECLACGFHKVTLAWSIFALKPSVPIHWCTETQTAWPKLKRYISENIPVVPDWCPVNKALQEEADEQRREDLETERLRSLW